MTRLHLVALLAVMTLSLALPGAALAQSGPPPHLFVGTATVDGEPARSGTMVFAFVEGKPAGSVAVDARGEFFLMALGPGREVTFKIGDYPATQTTSWEKGGAAMLNLTASSVVSGSALPHVFTGVVTVDGDQAPDGAVVSAWAGNTRIGSGLVRDGHYLLFAAQPAIALPVTFAVDEFIAAEEALWERGGATPLDLTVRSDVSLPGIALEPLRENLVRVFRFDNSTKTWDFYDPREEFGGANTLSGMVSGEAYWVKVTEPITVSVNGRPMTLTCAGDYCWNQIVW